MPDTDETEFGLWPTPDVPNGGRSMSAEDTLAKGNTSKGKRQVGLANAVKFWPTPKVATGDYCYQPGTKKKSLNLQGAVKLFNSPIYPTPTVRDHKGSYSPAALIRKDGAIRMDTLPQAARYHADGNPKHSGSLNPAWVEYLMGYPIGHTVSNASATPSSRKSRNCSSAK